MELSVATKEISLTETQKGIYFDCQIDDSISYNISATFLLENINAETIVVEYIESAIKLLIAEQEILRSSLKLVNDFPVLVVNEQANFELIQQNISSDTSTQKIQIKAIIEEEIYQPFELTSPPLFRCRLLKLDNCKYLFLICTHHIISDGISLSIFMKKLVDYYHKLYHKEMVVLKKDHGFINYSRRETKFLASAKCNKPKKYWAAKIKGAELLAIQTDFITKQKSGRGIEKRFEVSSDLVRAIHHLVKTQEVSEFTFYLACFNVLMKNYSGCSDVLLSSAFSYRPGFELEETIGCFIRTLPLRICVEENITFVLFLKKVALELIEMQKNIEYPGNLIVRDNLSLATGGGSSVFDVSFVFDVDEDVHAGNVRAKIFAQDSVTFPGNLMVILNKSDDDYWIKFQYKPDVFSDETIHLMAHRYLKLLKEIVVNINKKIKDIDLFIERERESVLNTFNQSNFFNTQNNSVIDIFTEKAKKFPDRIALIQSNRKFTYGEVYQKVNYLAHKILTLKSRNNECIGIQLERSAELVIATLAVLKVACAYVSINPEYPLIRKKYIISDAEISILITSRNLVVDDNLNVQHLIVEDEIRNLQQSEDIIVKSSPFDLIYIAYTSGSTGHPKGVMIENHSVVNILSDLEKRFPVKEGDIYLFKTSFSFDISVSEIFGWFMGEGSLFILEAGDEKNPQLIADEIERQGVSHINFAPSVFQLFLGFFHNKSNISKLKTLKWIFIGGEKFSTDILEKFNALCTNIQLVNFYGPTECTLWATHYSLSDFSDKRANIPIGRPLNDLRCYVVGENGQLQPIGIPGELYLSGVGLSRGYLNLPEMTQEKFIPNSFFNNEIDPIWYKHAYRTGDRVRWLPSGELEFLGRIDFQVKIRGMRLELGEVEQVLSNYEGVTQAVVVSKKHGSEFDILCAYYCAESEIPASKLKEYLSKVLPSYMIPSYFIYKNEWPLLSSGKVNRKALANDTSYQEKLKSLSAFSLPNTDLEIKIAKLWEDVLSVKKVGLDDNFFELGGHSLSLIQLNNKLQNTLNLVLPLNLHFQLPTVRLLTEHLSKKNKKANESRKIKFKKKEKSIQDDIAIIGLAINVPGAQDIDTFWGNLKEGRESLYLYSDDELLAKGVSLEALKSANYVKANGRIEGIHHFDANFFNYTPADVKLMSPQLRLMHRGLWEAFEDAGYYPNSSGAKIGLFLGASDEFDWYKKTLFPAHYRDKYQAFILGSNHFLATRLAYNFDIDGPTYSVLTACSTTLVTAHIACQSLRLGECDLAVAGGITIELPNESGYFYEPGLMFSPDGHCRPFDSRASGTVFSNGMGLVVLKRLSEAQNDGDNIYAVIKGSAINNDGRQKLGFTAPSVKGQAGAIQLAYRNSGIDPETVSYLEAHGTGTLLGDPIELESLTQAFATSRKQFCMLGSVKGNVGHTDTAAGVVSLVKVALSLKHKYIPPTVNFLSPNPKLELEKTPFMISSKGMQWEAKNGIPLRAGVNSFGVGGANAHAVLEEGPILRKESQATKENLLVFSAKSNSALTNTAEAVVGFILNHQNLNLSDVAWTLQIGRKAFNYRKYLVVNENIFQEKKETILNKLSRSFTCQLGYEKKPVFFLFSGQGSQYFGMGRDLYYSTDNAISCIFKRHIDSVFNLLPPKDQKTFWNIMYENDTNKINETEHSQFGLFAIGYALAKSLIELGIKPNGLIGHSIGEITAATISGVFQLEDAVNIVRERGRLMQNQEKGAMLAVMQDAKIVREYLENDIWLALDNTTGRCVVAGKEESIDKFSEKATERNWSTAKLKTSHAFHTPMMSGAAEAFRTVIANYKLNEPQIPIISNISGYWVAAHEICSSDYWAEHILQPVNFTQGLSEILKEEIATYIELGPGNVLCSLATQHTSRKDHHHFINLIRHQKEAVNDVEYLLSKIGHMWCLGVDVDWHVLKGNLTRYRVSLPTYVFDKMEFPIEVNQDLQNKHEESSKPISPVLSQKQYINPIKNSSQNEIQLQVIDAYKTVLGFAQVGIDQDFFALGGDSLKAVSLISVINENLKIRIDIKDIFQYPSPRALAEHIAQYSQARLEITRIQPLKDRPFYPLSSAQYRIYTLYLLDKKNTAYNLPSATLIKGKVDKEAFERTLIKLIMRHESLRTTFDLIENQVIQMVHDDAKLPFRYFESEASTPAEIEDLIHTFIKPFDLKEGPLLRAELIKIGYERYLLLFDIHHIVADGTSMEVFTRDFNLLYKENLPSLELQYRDFCVWQKEFLASGCLKDQKDYWLNHLRGELPVLNFPTDFPRSAVKNFKGDRIYFSLKQGISNDCNEFCKVNGVTPFMLFLSLWLVLLSRYANQEDIIIGVPSAGRTKKEINETIGMFVNMVPIRSAPSGNKKFIDFLFELKNITLDAFNNQEYQFDDLVRELNIKRDLTRNALFDVCFDFQNMEFYDFEVEGLEFSSYQCNTKTATYDLLLTLHKNNNSTLIEGFLEYSTELFNHETIHRMIENFRMIVDCVLNQKEVLIDTIDIVSQIEKEIITEKFNDTALLIQQPFKVHELFEENVNRVPDKVCLIISNGQNFTYRQLNEKANILASQLIELEIKNEQLVAVITDRDETLIASMLGIMKSGGAYLLIDPKLPTDRISEMLIQSNVMIVICSGKYRAKCNFGGIIIDPRIVDKQKPLLNNNNFIKLSGLDPQRQLACIIFTSGSTGKPKGVLILHSAILNFIADIKNRGVFQYGDDRVISVTTVSFDIFGFETLVPLCTGHSVYLANELEQLDPVLIAVRIVEYQVTHIVSTISRIQIFLENKAFHPALKVLKFIISGGENFPISLLDDLKTHSDARIYNMYGPTEVTIWCTTQELTHRNDINIGRPIANTEIYILNPIGKLQPIGVFGELCIGGAGLAKGYINLIEETSEKFVYFGDKGDKKIYKTGDRARFLSNGELELKGRLDSQIKLRGYRVELSEIENAVLNYPNISLAAALGLDDKNGVKQLILYCSPKIKNQLQTTSLQSQIRNWLKEKLPHYMLPAHIHILTEMPVLPNGKIDKNALKFLLEAEGPKYEKNESTVPLSELEQKLLSLWEEVLHVSEIRLNDNFFDLGGNSLGLIGINNKLSTFLGRPIPLLQLFEYPTIETLAYSLEQCGEKKISIISTEQIKSTDIAVIGMHCQFPEAKNIDEFWKNLVAGRESITKIQDEELLASSISEGLLKNPDYIKMKGVISDVEYFDSKFFGYTYQEAEIMDPQIRLLHQCVWLALENAGYNPFDYPGRIGLFTGSSSNILWVSQFIKDPHDLLNAYQAISLNERDFQTTRLSYKLNLKGPSYNIQAACSTSLVAIHHAVQVLLSGEADIAIAGGVSVSFPQKEGYLWQEGMIFSRDGHCRPFSENASGIVSGNGCGIVLLKPLSSALRDKDHIYAVIKGSAVNNDGSEKLGYTAPSITGQREVIETAIRKSEISPDDICYLEAHGTGTKIGDPIEVEALKRAWGTQRKNFCAIGSVKANIGHLDAAAGIASFIKSVLLIHNRTIPPLINYAAPNPFINFEDSPFFITTEAQPIDDPNLVLRVGVSSFGIGGTNAHVILEQPPPTTAKPGSAAVIILPFSAKTSEALVENCRQTLNFLVNNPEVSLYDAAWTLQAGRKAFEYRKALVVNESLTNTVNDLDDFINHRGSKIIDLKDSKLNHELNQKYSDLLSQKQNISTIQFGRILADLWCAGLDIRWLDAWEAEVSGRRIPLPTYIFEKEFHKHDITLSSEQINKIDTDTFDKDNNATTKEKIIHNLTKIWLQILGCKEVSANDDFFMLGGDSLKAVILSAQIAKVIHTKISIEEIFTHSDFMRMTDFLMMHSNTKQSDSYEIPLLANKAYYEISSAQKRLYFVNHLLEDSLPYNLGSVHLIEGSIDKVRLRNSVRALVQRHEAFRTSFHLINSEVFQKIDNEVPTPIEFSNEEDFEAEINKSIKPFDLSVAPLFRIKLITINPEKHVLVIDMHHIIADQTSITIFVEDLAALYSGKSLPPLRIQYKEFASWQNDRFRSNQLHMDYWKNEFIDKVPVVDLPIDFPRPQIQSFEGGRVAFAFGKKLSKRINAFAKNNNFTPYMFFMAALNLVLWKYSGQDDLVVGTGMVGREHADCSRVIGMFVNTLPIRIQVDDNLSVIAYLQYIKQKMIKAYENQNCQLEILIEQLKLEKDPSRNPLFDVVLNYINMNSSELELGDTSMKVLPETKIYSKFDLTWTIEKKEAYYSSDIEFATAVFTYESIQSLMKRLRLVLEVLIENPQLQLKQICLLTPSERDYELYGLNKTETINNNDNSIIQLFEEQVASRQHHPALIFQQHIISYMELNEQANQISTRLAAYGVRPGDKVAILLEQSFLRIFSIFGILKIGAAYVPIDPDYPSERINFILSDSSSTVLLTCSELLCKVQNQTKTLLLDRVFHESNNQDDKKRSYDSSTTSDSTAYVMYTSGSTGVPKGVEVSHRNVIYAVKDTKIVAIQPQDKLLQISNYVFDGSVFDIFGALLNGACLVLVDKITIIEMSLLANLIRDQLITLFYIPTALFNLLVDLELYCLKNVRKIIFGGEAASVSHVRKAFNFLGPDRLINGYGPTETTFFATYFPINEIHEHALSIPIGYPMSNAKLYLLDKQGQPVPNNIPGELYIGGAGVAKGYLNQEILTRQKFIEDPFTKNGKMYKSGDIVCRRPLQYLDFIRRDDTQAKIRGYRIEPGEIEYHIKSIPGVQNAVVLARKDKQGVNNIIAYYTLLNSNEIIGPDSINLFLKDKLPSYSLPSQLIKLDALPITSNGKIDTAALKNIDGTTNDYGNDDPIDKVEAEIMRHMKDVLELTSIRREDDFFRVGGNSIKAIALVYQLSKSGIKIKVSELFQFPTAEKIARVLLVKSREIQVIEKFSGRKAKFKKSEIDNLVMQCKTLCDLLSKSILSAPVINSFPLSPIQRLYHIRGSSLSGMTMIAGGKISEPEMRQLLTHLIQDHQLIHCVMNLKVSPCWNEYDISSIIPLLVNSIPYFDLQYTEKNLQTKIINKLCEYILGDDYQSESLLWRICCVRLSEYQHFIIWGFCHISFDGISSEVIRKQIENEISIIVDKTSPHSKTMPSEDKVHEYEAYVSLLKLGPQNINEQQIIDQFRLLKWAKANSFLMQQLAKGTFNISKPILCSIPLNELKTNNIWELAFNLSLNFVREYFEIKDVPLGIINFGRAYCGKEFYNSVGEFIDIIPFLVKGSESETEIFNRLEFCRKYGVNFVSLVFDPNLHDLFSSISSLIEPAFRGDGDFSDLILFNFQGYISKEDRTYFEKAIGKKYMKPFSKFSITVSYDDDNLTVEIESPCGLDAYRLQTIISFYKLRCREIAQEKMEKFTNV